MTLCSFTNTRSIIAGALANFSGLDILLGRFGAPRYVHWMLAAAIMDYYCSGIEPEFTANYAQTLALGFSGGILMSFLPIGPILRV